MQPSQDMLRKLINFFVIRAEGQITKIQLAIFSSPQNFCAMLWVGCFVGSSGGDRLFDQGAHMPATVMKKKKMGRPRKYNGDVTVKVGYSLPPELATSVVLYAKKQGLSASNFVARVLFATINPPTSNP